MICPLCSKEMSMTPKRHFDYISEKYKVNIVRMECTNCKIIFSNSAAYCSDPYDKLVEELENKFAKYKDAIVERWKKDETYEKLTQKK